MVSIVLQRLAPILAGSDGTQSMGGFWPAWSSIEEVSSYVLGARVGICFAIAA